MYSPSRWMQPSICLVPGDTVCIAVIILHYTHILNSKLLSVLLTFFLKLSSFTHLMLANRIHANTPVAISHAWLHFSTTSQCEP